MRLLEQGRVRRQGRALQQGRVLQQRRLLEQLGVLGQVEAEASAAASGLREHEEGRLLEDEEGAAPALLAAAPPRLDCQRQKGCGRFTLLVQAGCKRPCANG